MDFTVINKLRWAEPHSRFTQGFPLKLPIGLNKNVDQKIFLGRGMIT